MTQPKFQIKKVTYGELMTAMAHDIRISKLVTTPVGDEIVLEHFNRIDAATIARQEFLLTLIVGDVDENDQGEAADEVAHFLAQLYQPLINDSTSIKDTSTDTTLSLIHI